MVTPWPPETSNPVNFQWQGTQTFPSMAYNFAVINFLLALPVQALSPAYIACQLQKPNGISALTSCPEGTLYVSKTDPEARYTSVQSAISSL